MVKINLTLLTGLIMLPLISILSGCDKAISQEYGFLEGVISIGPLCPVETDPPSPGCLPTAETYLAYPVSIWTSDGKVRISKLSPALDGSFRLSLLPGQYTVRLDNKSGIGSGNLPVEVVISATDRTTLDIVIDTGIR